MLVSAVTNVAGGAMKQLDQRPEGHYDQRAPQERRGADYVIDHCEELNSYNSDETAPR